MHKIEIDDEVYDFLKRQAEPFRDTPNSVLRRLLLKKPFRPEPVPVPPQPEGFAHRFLAKTFNEIFTSRSPYRMMFESPNTIVYFQNFDKPGRSNLWYRLNKKPLDTMRKTRKGAFLCFTNPAESYAYLIPLAHLDDHVPASRWKGESLEVNIDPADNRWRGLDWKLDTYFKKVKG
jgi:hypothetical protein